MFEYLLLIGIIYALNEIWEATIGNARRENSKKAAEKLKADQEKIRILYNKREEDKLKPK